MPEFSQEAQALIGIMSRQYEDIRAIEAAHQIFGREGDYRPRIEYYHDAVRALTSGEDDGSKHSRLSVERLAYDIGMLRHIQAKPLLHGRSDTHLSPHTDVAVDSDSGEFPRPDRDTRQHLVQLYKDYTVLFAAIFSEKADNNAQIRTEEATMLVEDCQTLEDLMQKLSNGDIDMTDLITAVHHLEHDELRAAILQLIQAQKEAGPDLANMSTKVHETTEKLHQEINAIQTAATSYSLAQLAVYEDAKETVKRLAAQGMNIAGKFVENAISQSQGQGRGI